MSDQNEHTRYDHLTDEKLSEIVQELAEHGHIEHSTETRGALSLFGIGEEVDVYNLLGGYMRGTTALTDTMHARPDDVKSFNDLTEVLAEANERNLVGPIVKEQGQDGPER